MVGDWGPRGQSTVLGSVLIFGILILALSSYQVTVVPQENTNVEYQSYLQASDDLSKLQNDIRRTAATGAPVSSSIESGTLYPVRAIAVNPPPATGRVTTTQSRPVALANVSAVNDETADYWNGSNRSYGYQSVRFSPGYNEFSGSPIVANSILTYRDTETAQIPLSSQTLVQGNRISLTVLQGEFSESGLDVTVVSDPVSHTQRTVPVTANDTAGQNITLTVPSAVSAATWRTEILESQLQENGGNIVSISQTGEDSIQIELAGTTPSGDLITYQLQLSYVEVRSESSPASLSTNTTYLTTTESTTDRISTGETAVLSGQVRDAFNNPSASANITFTLNTTASGQLVGDADGDGVITVSSASDGRVKAEYSPSMAGDVTVTASADLDGSGTVEPDETIEYTVFVSGVSGAGGGGGTATAGVTNGGISTWDPTNDTQTLAAPNGRWENISETGSINVSQGEDGFDFNGSSEQFELLFSLENSTDTYAVAVIVGDGNGPRVQLAIDGNSVTQTLQSSAATEITDDDAVAVNIMDSQNGSIYSSSDSTFEQYAANIRNMTAGGDTVVLRTGLGRARANVRFDEAISRYQAGGGGGGTNLQSIDAAASTSGGSGKASFVLQNTGSSTVTVTGIRINSTTSGATEVSGPGTNAELTSNDTAVGDLVTTTIVVGGNQEPFDNNQPISPGESIEFSFNRFNGGVSGSEVTITIYLVDGSTETFTLSY